MFSDNGVNPLDFDALGGVDIPTLSDFETALRGPDGAAAKAAALARLDAILVAVSQAMKAGIPRQDYGDAEKIRIGLEAARAFLDKVATARATTDREE